MGRRTTDTHGLYLAMDETERAIVKKLTEFTHEGSASAMLRQLIVREALHYQIPVPRKAFTRRTFTWNTPGDPCYNPPMPCKGKRKR